MIRINNIKMPVKHTENDLKKTVYKLYRINEKEVKSFEIAGQAIDARKKDNVVFVYAVDISFKFDEEKEKKRFENVKNVRKIEKKPYFTEKIENFTENESVKHPFPVHPHFSPAQ